MGGALLHKHVHVTMDLLKTLTQLTSVIQSAANNVSIQSVAHLKLVLVILALQTILQISINAFQFAPRDVQTDGVPPPRLALVITVSRKTPLKLTVAIQYALKLVSTQHVLPLKCVLAKMVMKKMPVINTSAVQLVTMDVLMDGAPHRKHVPVISIMRKIWLC